MTTKRIIILSMICFLVSIFAVSSASAFDWKTHDGTTIKLLLNKHPYTNALLAHLGEFTEKTGITVTYDVFPEDEYFDKVTISLSSKSPEYSIFMTGAYQVWQYAPPGYMEDLGPYMKSAEKTNPDWDQADIYQTFSHHWPGTSNPAHPWGTPKQNSGPYPGAFRPTP